MPKQNVVCPPSAHQFPVADGPAKRDNGLPMRTFRQSLRLACLVIPYVTAIENSAPAAEGLPADAHELNIGQAAPDFSLRSVDGSTYSLAGFKEAPILMV